MPKGQYDRKLAKARHGKPLVAMPYDHIDVQPIKPVVNPLHEKGLTQRQEKFCKLYATENYTVSECVVMAGYSTDQNAVWSMGSKLLNGRDYPNVVARIRELKQEMAGKYEVNFDNHVRRLAEIRDAAVATGNYAAAVTAEKARGQAAGLYVTRQEILVGKIDQMSKEELIEEIAKLNKEYPALIELSANPVLELTTNDARSKVVEPSKRKD